MKDIGLHDRWIFHVFMKLNWKTKTCIVQCLNFEKYNMNNKKIFMKNPHIKLKLFILALDICDKIYRGFKCR